MSLLAYNKQATLKNLKNSTVNHEKIYTRKIGCIGKSTTILTNYWMRLPIPRYKLLDASCLIMFSMYLYTCPYKRIKFLRDLHRMSFINSELLANIIQLKPFPYACIQGNGQNFWFLEYNF